MSSFLSSNKIPQLSFLTALALISFVFFNVFLSAVLFIFKVSITIGTTIASFVLSIGLIGFGCKRCNLNRTSSVIAFIIIVSIFLAAITSSIVISNKIIDSTYDGNTYHKNAIGKLHDGWNPVYENLEEFDSQSENSFSLTEASSFWENHYAKASHIFSANIYKLTHNIESGKSINFISLLALFFISTSYLLYKKKSLLFTFLFSIISTTFPIFASQMFSNYVDLLLGIYLFVLIICFFIFEEKDFFETDMIPLILFVMALSIMINIKFSSFAYAGIFCLGYYLWYVYRLKTKDISKRFFIHLTGSAFIAVFIGVFIIGLSVYPKNLIDHGHPFYPLFGEGKVDIMTSNSPAIFPQLSAIERFILGTFSEVDSIYAATNAVPTLKIPFTASYKEYQLLYVNDLRISGHGIFFSGIFLISLVVIIIACLYRKKIDRKMFCLTMIPLAITTVMIFVLEESWWARYFPQLLLFPLFSVLLLDNTKHFAATSIKIFLIAALLANNTLTLMSCYTHISTQNAKIDEEITYYRTVTSQTDKTVILYGSGFYGSLYNAIDYLPEGVQYRIDGQNPPSNECSTIGYTTWSLENE